MTTETRPALRYPEWTDGIDISEAQIISDAAATAAAGFVFATVKVSEGTSYVDPKALDSLKKLRDAGLICNTYTFLRPSQGDPARQIDKAYDAAGDVFPLRMLLDLESAPNGMPADELVAFGEEAADECLKFGALEGEFYSFPNFITTRLMPALARSTRLARCGLNIASYGPGGAWLPARGSHPFICAPWNAWTKWQYSGDGGFRVPGIVGDCDRELFNGSLEAFRRYMGLDVKVEALPAIVHPDVELDEPARDYD